MWFFMRQIMRYGRFLAWSAAVAVAGVVYAFLTSHETITLFGGEPHVIEWWEPYAWPAVTFIVVGRLLRMALNRTVGAANSHVARIRRGDVFRPKK